MERVHKESGGTAQPKRTVQRKAGAGSLVGRINSSPMMVAQRERMNGLFGGAIRRSEPARHLENVR